MGEPGSGSPARERMRAASTEMAAQSRGFTTRSVMSTSNFATRMSLPRLREKLKT